MRAGRRDRRLLTAICTMAAAMPVYGGVLGGNIALTGPPCSFPDAAYSPEEDCYLVVWVDYGVAGLPAVRGRLLKIGPDGLLPQPAFAISDPADRSFFPSIAYNPTAHEFLVTWDREDAQGIAITVYGRRIWASDGTPLQTGFQIGATPSVQRSAAAWSTTSQRYLVAYSNFDNAFARFINGSGQPITGDFMVNDSSGHAFFPAVSWAPSSDVFLITWDHGAPNSQDFIRRRVVSAAGQWLTDPLTITSGAAESRSTIAHDDLLGRWLVQYNEAAYPGQSFDQYARFIRDDGTLDGSVFPIADSPVFEGDTILGSDIAFAPGAGVYFSSFVTPIGICGRLCNRNGNRLRTQVTLGTIQDGGDFTRHNNAADALRNQFLTVWEGNPIAASPSSIYAQLYTVCAPVTGLSAVPEPDRIRLSWTQPADVDMTHVIVRFGTAGTPVGPGDGTLAADLAVTPGAGASFLHVGLDHHQAYHYAVFAYDGTNPIYSPGAAASATPALPGDLDGDGDVDQEDFGLFQACLAGPGDSYPLGCALADLEGDGDVDQDDFGVFESCLGGADHAPGC